MVLKNKKINMNEEEREAKKSLFLKIGVISVFALVFVLWLLNIQGVFGNISNQTNKVSWAEVSAEIDKNTKEAEARLGINQPDTSTNNEFIKKLLDKTANVASSSVSSSTAILEIKKELLDLTKNTSTPVIPATRSNCPAYINCMPTIGEARPCVIPAGCENITQIAY